jgi:hypothetical protein
VDRDRAATDHAASIDEAGSAPSMIAPRRKRGIALVILMVAVGVGLWQGGAHGALSWLPGRAGPDALPVGHVPGTAPTGSRAPSSPPAKPPASDAAAVELALQRYLREIARDGDPRHRLLALRMLHSTSMDRSARRAATREAARVLAQSPGDPLVALMQRWFCDPIPESCSEAQRDAWLRMQPRNAAAHLDALAGAQSDSLRFDAALANAARSEVFDSYYLELSREAAVMMEGMPLPPITPAEARFLDRVGEPHTDAARRQVFAGAVIAAIPMANLSGVSRGCRPPLPAHRIPQCRVVLMQLARGSTFLERGVAYGTLARMLSGTQEGAYWAEQRRRLRWWTHQMGRITTGVEYWRSVLRYGEIEATRRVMLRAGVPLEPPPGWQPPYR